MSTEKVTWFPGLNHAGEAIALVDGERSLTYTELNDAVSHVIAGLLNGEASLKEERVAFLYPASFDYAALIIGVVAAGGIAVPLSVHASAGELSHCLSVAGVRRLLLPSEMRSKALALWRGATVDLYARFDVEQVCKKVANDRYSVFMAVPTIYVKLVAYLKTLDDATRDQVTEGFANMRLNVSGSAACPVPLFDEWETLTSQRFLERYGMTELGMALSNPYEGERRPGHVGQPLPCVVIKRVSESGEDITDPATPGELAVKSRTAFREYWGNPESTAKAFADGWFLTGDIAVVDEGAYRILGRASIHIIKSGGYKLSALEIEATLLEHPDVSEAAVIGVPDDEWGEIVAAAVVLANAVSEGDLVQWSRERMSGYKVPRKWIFTDALPRNALGKVTKPVLNAWFEG